MKRTVLFLAKLLLIAEALWLGGTYIKDHTSERAVRRYESDASGESEGEIYGIGIEKDRGNLFLFHKDVREAE